MQRAAAKKQAQLRIEKDGGSILLGKKWMQKGYVLFWPLGVFLAKKNISPHWVSFLSGGFGIFAGIAIAQGRWWFGFGMLLGAFVLDVVDGMVARIEKVASDAGEVVDALLDRFVEMCFFLGAMIYYRFSWELELVVGVAWLGSFFVSYISLFSQRYHVLVSRGLMRRPERAFYLLLGVLLSGCEPWLWGTWIWRGKNIAIALLLAFILVAIGSIGSSVLRAFQLWKALESKRKKPERKHL